MRAARAPLAWLGASLLLTVIGAAVWAQGSPWPGALTLLLGTVALGVAAASELRARRLTSASLARMEERIAELRAIEDRLRSLGLTPIEETYRHLIATRRKEDGPPLPDPAARPHPGHERRLRERIAARCDRIWQGIGEHRYVQRDDGGRVIDLDWNAIFQELRAMVEEVAAIHHAGAERALLEARLGDTLLAVRSIAGDLVQLIREVPGPDLATWSIEEVIERYEKLEQGMRLYRAYQPYDKYVAGAVLGVRLAAGSHPLTLAAWYLGRSGASHLATHVVKTRLETYLRGLLEALVAMCYVQASRAYVPDRALATADWRALTEAARLNATLPPLDHNRRLLLSSILQAPLGDEFAKLDLLRALAADRTPDDRAFGGKASLDALAPAERVALADRLRPLLAGMRGLAAAPARTAIADLERRLGHGLGVDYRQSGSPPEVLGAEGMQALAGVARHLLGLDPTTARERLGRSELAERLLLETGAAVCADLVSAAVGSVFAAGGDTDADTDAERSITIPRSLTGGDLAQAFAASAVTLLSEPPADGSLEAEELLSSLLSLTLDDRKRIEAEWRRYLSRTSEQLAGLLALEAHATWPEALAPTVLRRLGTHEHPLTILAGRAPGARTGCWLVPLVDRLLVVEPPPDDPTVGDLPCQDVAWSDVTFEREPHRLLDELVVRFHGRTLVAYAGRSGSFERRFGDLLAALGQPAAALRRVAPAALDEPRL